MTPADVLNKAADLIERDGWWDGASELGHRSCAVMAISGIGQEAEYFAAMELLRRHVGIDSDSDVAEWNDAQPDGATVIAALRAAAQKAS